MQGLPRLLGLFRYLLQTSLRIFMDCDHTKQDSWWEYDYQGIPLARVCVRCVEAKLSQYRPEILEGYTQADVDERIEEE